MEIKRRRTRVVRIGQVNIGGNHPIAIQSMAKTRTADIDKTIKQIKELERVGCEIVRVAVKDSRDAQAIRRIKNNIKLPLVADIHFHWRLALEAIENGADKIRLNPGNIYKERELKDIIAAAKGAKIPLRIGVNSGSVREMNSKNLSMAERLVRSALSYIRVIEKVKFSELVISLKGADALDTIEAYRRMAKFCDYPFHLGVTATGPSLQGTIKSSITIGVLLLEGIGDTIRISLTDKPEEEVKVAKYILQSLGLRNFGPQIISCPTCGRCQVDLVKMVKELEKRLSTVNFQLSTPPLKVAVMGCVVNGPGEAKEADLGVAFGAQKGALFKGGRPIQRVFVDRCVSVLLKEICSGQRRSSQL